MTVPDDWVCYATYCYKPYPPGFGIDIVLLGVVIGLAIGIAIVSFVVWKIRL